MIFQASCGFAVNTFFLLANPFDPNEQTIDFANPEAVKTLNAALLKMF
jgi:23S rRNA A1618 N6-methylase RlmF